MDELIEEKIKESKEVLEGLGLPESQQNRISALTLLALANLKPSDKWNSATRKSMTLSKDIMKFVNTYYKADYKANTRESFRKNALRYFVENNIAVLNPDDPSLSTTSSKTHYSVSEVALNAIKKFGTQEWDNAITDFKRDQFPENMPSSLLVSRISISNFKSILEDTIELGRFNVFIGVNGCGKSNILESLAAFSAAKAGDLNFEGLYGRGVRLARPDLIASSFLNTAKKGEIDIHIEIQDAGEVHDLPSTFFPEDVNDIYTKWIEIGAEETMREDTLLASIKGALANSEFEDRYEEIVGRMLKELSSQGIRFEQGKYLDFLSEYCIYDLNTKSLRGITPADSRKTPLGINGEGLDLLISNFNSYEKGFLDNKARTFFSWLDKIQNDKDERSKSVGLKAGRSSSTLYFTDKFMQKQNNILSAENSNEGILHVLFYLALFISNKTPNLFAIDNIETALNPRLCQTLITALVDLAKQRGKQVLITTHNPAVLDGLNLLDDEQRLFVVYRNDEGHTKTRRIKFKRDLSDKKFKLSEMWLKGSLGAVPENFA